MDPAPTSTFSHTLLYTTIASPIGELLLLGDGHALRGLYMQYGRKPMTGAPRSRERHHSQMCGRNWGSTSRYL
jgi:hypothetical protein